MTENDSHPLTREQRADIVSARETIRRAASGDLDADLDAAAALLDHLLVTTCPHDQSQQFRAPDQSGNMLVTCFGCNVSWYETDS